jgi:hypothetical protein
MRRQQQIFAAKCAARNLGQPPIGGGTPRFCNGGTTDARNFAADSLQMQQTGFDHSAMGCG